MSKSATGKKKGLTDLRRDKAFGIFLHRHEKGKKFHSDEGFKCLRESLLGPVCGRSSLYGTVLACCRTSIFWGGGYADKLVFQHLTFRSHAGFVKRL